jgi:alanyl-tRNA synthetase
MQPLTPYLLGASHPAGDRLVNSQPCFRAEDIDEVGDTRHTTFFEMLGNWSLGSYFKDEQLPWLFSFLAETLRLDPERLVVTVFAGSPRWSLPRDDESAHIDSRARDDGAGSNVRRRRRSHRLVRREQLLVEPVRSRPECDADRRAGRNRFGGLLPLR